MGSGGGERRGEEAPAGFAARPGSRRGLSFKPCRSTKAPSSVPAAARPRARWRPRALTAAPGSSCPRRRAAMRPPSGAPSPCGADSSTRPRSASARGALPPRTRCPPATARDATRALEPMRMGTAIVDKCPGCGGHWFDGDEIEHAADLTTQGVSREEAIGMRRSIPAGSEIERVVKYLRCVRCGEVLTRRQVVQRAGVIVDVCRRPRRLVRRGRAREVPRVRARGRARGQPRGRGGAGRGAPEVRGGAPAGRAVDGRPADRLGADARLGGQASSTPRARSAGSGGRRAPGPRRPQHSREGSRRDAGAGPAPRADCVQAFGDSRSRR